MRVEDWLRPVPLEVALLAGCAAGDNAACLDDDCAHEASDGIGEPIATAEEPIFGPYDVGIIPHTDFCPWGTENIKIHMDDEDDGNANSRAGWIGATVSNINTTFVFCRVDGTSFWPLTTTTDASRYYAVLKLGSACPNGSVEFSRYFDNEDSGNENWYTTSISYPPTIWPNESGNSFTHLRFCLFRNGSSTMPSFPWLGISYGVFAASWFGLSAEKGWVHTDDEDSSNNNGYNAPSYIVVRLA